MVTPDWLARSMAAFAVAGMLRLPDYGDNPIWDWMVLASGGLWLAISLGCLIMWKIQQ